MGNDGVSELDYAAWDLGFDTHPTQTVIPGSKYFFDDSQQFPDTQRVVFEYPGGSQMGDERQLIVETRLWSSNNRYNVENGVEFLGTWGTWW